MTRCSRRRKWLAGLVVLLMGISAYLGTVGWKINLNVPLLDGSTITVVPGVHLLGGLGPAAAYVVETSEGLVLIDTGLDGDARLLKSEMEKLGLDWMRLRAIFLTHVHGDHCGGAERLRAETGARVHAGQGDAPILVAGEPRDAFFSTFKMPDHSPHPTAVDVTLQGGETISIGDVRFQILDTPGHTDGSTCYLMERAGLRVLFSGDVIFRLGEKPLGTYSTYLAPRYRGNAKTYLSSLEKLKTLPVPDLVLPGHPSASRGPQSPRLSQQNWDEMLERGMREMERLAARFEADGSNFLDGHPKQLLPELYYLGDFHGAAVYGFFAASKFFVVDAPGGPGLDEFLKEQLGELGLNPTEPHAILLTACGEKEMASLQELVERNNAQVIASPDGFEAIRKKCPPGTTVISTDDLRNKGWFSVIPIPLVGRGLAPIAYVVRWAGKTVLFSGGLTSTVDQQSSDERPLQSAISRQNTIDKIESIHRLAKVQPDLWLPAIPLDAQNANLYDGDWEAILKKNDRVLNDILQGP